MELAKISKCTFQKRNYPCFQQKSFEYFYFLIRLFKHDIDILPPVFEENEKLKNVMKNIGQLLVEPPYEPRDGYLNSSPYQIQDFKITLASAIVPEYR